MNKQTVDTFRTRLDKVAVKDGGKSQITNITIDWDISEEELQALAQAQLIVRYQNVTRQAGEIPPTDVTIKASEYKLGVRHAAPKFNPETATPEELQEYINKLQEVAKRKAAGFDA